MTDPAGAAGSLAGAPIPLPPGFRIALDRSVRRYDAGRVLLGGDPRRVLRLSATGQQAVDRMLRGCDSAESARWLGRRLVDAGVAHPRPPAPATAKPSAPATAVTVVIPVKDRPRQLVRCLDALDRRLVVVVVDDGSRDPGPVAAVCAAHGARLIPMRTSAGPAAARNAGLAEAGGDLIAFLDSDCVPEAGWLPSVVAHFADPAVGAVAPRIRPLDERRDPTLLDRFLDARSPLDMGPREGMVAPGGRLAFVPSAAVVVRRSAVPSGGFDPALRHGEDVDLVWRLHDAGWRVRYEPEAVVRHAEPASWGAALDRRRRYGTAAAALAARHPGRLSHLVLGAWPAAWCGLALAGRFRLGGALTGVQAIRLARRLRTGGVSPYRAPSLCAQSLGGALTSLGRAATMLTPAGLAAACLTSRGRHAALALLLAPPLAEWARRRPALDPLRWATGCIADDVAYGIGVWQGCVRGRTLAPMMPGRRDSPNQPQEAPWQPRRPPTPDVAAAGPRATSRRSPASCSGSSSW